MPNKPPVNQKLPSRVSPLIGFHISFFWALNRGEKDLPRAKAHRMGRQAVQLNRGNGMLIQPNLKISARFLSDSRPELSAGCFRGIIRSEGTKPK